MNDTPINRQAAHEQLQSRLINAALQRIEQEVGALISSDITKTVRKAILGEVLPNARFGLEGLGVEQLQSESVVRRYVDAAVGTAEFLVDRVLTTKGINVMDVQCPWCEGSGSLDLFDDYMTCDTCSGSGLIPCDSK